MSHCRPSGGHCHPHNAAVFTAAAAARRHQQQVAQHHAQAAQSHHHSQSHSAPQHTSSNYSPTMFSRATAPQITPSTIDKEQQALENEWSKQSVTL